MNPFEMLLAQAFLQQMNAPKMYENRNAAENALKGFLETKRPELAAGDSVERNELGRTMYQIPGDDQAAIVVEQFAPRPQPESGLIVDTRIVVALSKDNFRHYDVDSRALRVVGSNRVNVYDFKKKS